MAIQILGEYARPTGKSKHTPANDIESIIYVFIWICICYEGPGGAVRQDVGVHETALEPWVSAKSFPEVLRLSWTKAGQAGDPGGTLDDFTAYHEPLVPLAKELFRLIHLQRQYEQNLEKNLVIRLGSEPNPPSSSAQLECPPLSSLGRSQSPSLEHPPSPSLEHPPSPSLEHPPSPAQPNHTPSSAQPERPPSSARPERPPSPVLECPPFPAHHERPHSPAQPERPPPSERPPPPVLERPPSPAHHKCPRSPAQRSPPS
ncbi:hypothetical protein BV22DRAFT_1135973, partial [Leucogyrophana mollusca]